MLLEEAKYRSLCLGSPGIPPVVHLRGVAEGRAVKADADTCEWPSGTGAAVWYAAFVDTRSLSRALARLKCGELAGAGTRRTTHKENQQIRDCFTRTARVGND
jgi:hypothetical protein